MTSIPYEAPQVRQSVFGILASGADLLSFREDGFGSTTYGRLGYHRLDPTETSEPITLNTALEARLSVLCDKLRAKY